jgi:hypothetical protein
VGGSNIWGRVFATFFQQIFWRMADEGMYGFHNDLLTITWEKEY